MDIGAALKVKQAWDTFASNHPKFPMFLKAVTREGIKEDTIIAISVTTPDGRTLDTNVKVTASDLELFESLKGLKP